MDAPFLPFLVNIDFEEMHHEDFTNTRDVECYKTGGK